MQWLNGLKITPERLMDNTADDTITSGLLPATGWSVSSFTGKRLNGFTEVNILMTRTGADITESAAGTGNIIGEPEVCTLPAGWAPSDTRDVLWGSSLSDGGALITNNGVVQLRSISGSSGIPTNNTVRIVASWISETPSDRVADEETDITSYSDAGLYWVTGAAGDGTTDDAPAIQAQLDKALSQGGGWVIIPPGTYKLATLPLRIYRNTRLTLLPGATFVRAANATLLLNGDADQNFGAYSGHGNLIIEGGRWEMQALAAGLTASRMCISLGHAENITIRDVEIRDTPGFHAVEVNACRHVRIENSRFLGYVDPGGRDLSEAIQIDLAGSSGHFGGFGPYDNTHCYDVAVTGCHFSSSGTPGTTAWPRGIGSHAAVSGMWHERIRIENNDFEGCGQYAVGGYSWSDVVIVGNTAVACGAGFWLRVPDVARGGFTQDCFNAAISGNVVYSCTGYDDPIIIQGESGGRMRRVTISGNTIDASVGGQNGIRLQFAEEYAISGNTVHDCSGSGISLFDANDGSAVGNKVDNVTVHGIMTDTSTNVLIAANHISVCGTNGLYAIRGGGLKWDGNLIRAAGRTDGTGFGMRASTSVVGLTITNNTYRKFGSGNEAVNAIGLTNTVSGVRRFGNDVLGQGNPTAIVDSSPTPNLSPYDTGA